MGKALLWSLWIAIAFGVWQGSIAAGVCALLVSMVAITSVWTKE